MVCIFFFGIVVCNVLKQFIADCFDNVHVESPGYDYIPPELVDLFVTNLGGHNPSYIYRLLVEFYNPEDTLDNQHQ